MFCECVLTHFHRHQTEDDLPDANERITLLIMLCKYEMPYYIISHSLTFGMRGTGKRNNKGKFGESLKTENSWQPIQNGLATQFWVATQGLRTIVLDNTVTVLTIRKHMPVN